MATYKTPWRVASFNFRHWRKDVRVGFIFMFTAILVIYYVKPFLNYGMDYRKNCTPFLLPLLFGGNQVSVASPKLLFYVGMLMLFCDAPFMYPVTPYMLIRSRRNSWWIGECIYIVLASLLYISFISLVCLIVVLPVITWKDTWGSAAYELRFGSNTMSANELKMKYGLFYWSASFFRFLNPIGSFLYCFFSGWASFAVLGLTMYLATLRTKQVLWGFCFSGAMIFLDPLLNWIASLGHQWARAFSPVCWSSVELLKLVDDDYFVTIPFAAGMYIVLILLLVIGIGRCSRKTAIEVGI